jgi:hypothetical protein
MKTCSLCGNSFDDNILVCPHCSGLDDMPINAKEWIRQVEMGYSKEMGEDYPAKGLQKDAIQNGWGARINKKGTGWDFEFELIEDKQNGNFLLVTDKMCHGLTGPDIKEIKETERWEKLRDPNCRLARFRSMLYSGDNLQGAGKFGRGKTLYLASSKKHHIIYDSLTKSEYKLGFTKVDGDRLRNSSKVFINDEAKKYLRERISDKIKPLSDTGTRIIIVDPKEELVEAVKNRNLLKYISDTWWLIIERGLSISVTYKGKREEAFIPPEFKDLSARDTQERKCRTYNVSFDYKGDLCKFKKAQLFLSKKKLSEEMQGLYLYRREMKVAQIDLREVPPEIAEKFYGYAELETPSTLENIYMEQEVESLEHSSFNGYKGIFQSMKRALQERAFDVFKEEMGYGHYKGEEEKKTKEASEQALAELEKEWPDLGALGGGLPPRTKKKIKIRLASLRYPRPADKYVLIGEDLTDIVFKIKNISSVDIDLKIAIKTIDENDKLIEEIISEDASVKVGKSYSTTSCAFNVTNSKYGNLDKFYVLCECRNFKNEVEDEKKVPISIGPTTASFTWDVVSLSPSSIIFPRPKRADFGEKVTQIEYRVKNETSLEIFAMFKLRVLDAATRQVEELLFEKELHLMPNAEEDMACPDFQIEAEKYKKLIEGGERGVVILRASIINLKDFTINSGGTSKTYSKADKLAISDIRFGVNCDPGKGLFDRVECGWPGGEEEPKSKVMGTTFILNNAHPEFKLVVDTKDLERRKNYIYEQYCRQVLGILVTNEMYDKWPDHPRYPDYKKAIGKERTSKVDVINAIFYALDHKMAVHYR